MPVDVTRETTVAASRSTVWSFIADPANRASAISVVDDYEVHDDDTATWYVEPPLPLVGQTVAVDTTETDRRPPEYVRFVGSASGLEVRGTHRLLTVENGTKLRTRLVVAGGLPGIEGYFERQLDQELANIEAALQRWV